MTVRKAVSFEPMLCESIESPPEGRQWQYELKLDGFRAVGRKSGRSAQLWSRNHKDFSRRFPKVLNALQELPGDTVIDGEVVGARPKRQALVQPLAGLWQSGRNRPLHVRSAHAAGQGYSFL